VPKATKLLDELLNADPIRTGPKIWADRMRSESPKLMEEFDEIIKLFHAKDQRVIGKRPTALALAKWFLPKVPYLKKPEQIAIYIKDHSSGATRGA
jgi:hypothetical protein